MILNELTTPLVSDLPVRELADHLLLGSGFADDGSQDPVLEICLRAAFSAIEARIGKALLTRRFSWQLTRWRNPSEQGLPVAPVTAIDAVLVVAGDGVETLVDPARYGLSADSTRPRLRGAGRVLPVIPEGGHVVIEMTAGFGIWTSVPADLRQAVLILAASYFENRSGAVRGANGMPFGVLALIEQHRAIRLLGDM